MNGRPTACAMASAHIDLPVPDGPYRLIAVPRWYGSIFARFHAMNRVSWFLSRLSADSIRCRTLPGTIRSSSLRRGSSAVNTGLSSSDGDGDGDGGGVRGGAPMAGWLPAAPLA